MAFSRAASLRPSFTVLIVAACMLLAGLGSFGIWQPAELRMADAVRSGGDPSSSEPDAASQRPPFQQWTIRTGFRVAGQNELGGRLPGALLAFLATLALAASVASASDARTGALAGIAYATLPLVYLNARQMFGGGVAQSGFTLFFAAVVHVLWGRPPPWHTAESPAWKWGRYGLLLTLFPAVAGAGWMLGAAPVLLGLALAVMIRWSHESAPSRALSVVLLVAGAAVAGIAMYAAAATAVRPLDAYNAWIGVGADAHSPGTLPTYESFVEQVAHGAFPWTGILAFGLVRLLSPPPGADDEDEAVRAHAWTEGGLRIGSLAVAVAAFGLQSFHYQQFGISPFIAAAPLAVGCAVLLRDAERIGGAWRVVTAGVTFFTLIVFRDYMLFPKQAYAALGLADGGPAFPVGFTKKAMELKEWIGAQGLLGVVRAAVSARAPAEIYFSLGSAVFALLALPALFQGNGDVKPFAQSRPWKWLGETDRFFPWTAWKPLAPLAGFGVLRFLTLATMILVVVASGGFYAFSRTRVPTPVAQFTLGLAVFPVVVVVAVHAVILLWNVFAWLGRPDGIPGRWIGGRVALVSVAAVLVGFVQTQWFVPALSEHLSPRGVWAVIRDARRPGEPVARYGGSQGDRATRYYADGEVRDLFTETEAVEWLSQREPRHFLVTGADVFASLNKAYRASQPQGRRQNVPVIDATNSNLYVAASALGAGSSRNPLEPIVGSVDRLTGTGDHWHEHSRAGGAAEPARFDDAIEYLGFNLDSNNQSFVPVGGSFKIKYHFHVLREVAGNHQIFVHVDGPCPRINGDHEPAQGRYPLRYWLAGDYIHDEQTITIPGYCRPGTYSVFIGFFQGDDRMRVTGGQHDAENRVIAARITVH